MPPGARCLAYGWLSLRLGWLTSILLSWGVFFGLTALLERVSLALIVVFAGVNISLAVALWLLPAAHASASLPHPPRWETPLRMCVASAFVVVLTAAAGFLGPQLSGLLTPFPVYASILAVFTHHFQGAADARQLLRGVVSGSFTFAVFFLARGSLLASRGIATAFGLAVLAALLMHGGVLFLLKRNKARPGRAF